MSIDFSGQVVVITGAGGGLGREHALEIGRRGGSVVVNDLGGNVDGVGGGSAMADQVVAEVIQAGGKAIASYDSVATSEGGQRIIQTAIENFGRVDAVIANAGNLRNSYFENFTDADRDSLFDIHLKGTWNVVKAVWPVMQKQQYGRLVFVSSGAGMFGNQTQAGYGAAKGGITGLMNVLAQEGAKYGIMCNGVLPNAASRMAEKMVPEEMAPVVPYTMKMGETLSPPFITPAVVYLCSQDCTTTHDLYSVLGGRIARAFIGVTEGWVGPRDTPPSVEDVAAHIEQIRDVDRGVHIPASMIDEFRIVCEQIEKSEEVAPA